MRPYQTRKLKKLPFFRLSILLLIQLCLGLSIYGQNSYTIKSPKFIEGIELNRDESKKTIQQPAVFNSGEKPQKELNFKNTAEIENSTSLHFKYAQLLDIDVERLNNKELYPFIDEWMNTPYRFGGNSKSGIDCSGFTGMIYKNIFDIQLPRMASEQYKICKKTDRENLTEGDLVFFNTRGGISHVGLYLHNGFFAHASTNHGVIISNLDEGYYHDRFIGGGRVTEKNENFNFGED